MSRHWCSCYLLVLCLHDEFEQGCTTNEEVIDLWCCAGWRQLDRNICLMVWAICSCDTNFNDWLVNPARHLNTYAQWFSCTYYSIRHGKPRNFDAIPFSSGEDGSKCSNVKMTRHKTKSNKENLCAKLVQLRLLLIILIIRNGYNIECDTNLEWSIYNFFP